MFGWVESVRSIRNLRGEGSARLAGLVETARVFGREQAARLLGWGGPEVEDRAKLLTRMAGLIVRGLRTKSYDQFVAAFSNPGREPDALQRLSRKANFQLRISPTCWYDASIAYGRDKVRTLRLTGGGDDFGVCIAADAVAEELLVAFHHDYDERAGRDAYAMVRALAKLPD